MKIVQFLPWSPSNIGGTEIYVLNLSNQLIKAGEEVVIICPSDTKSFKEFHVNGVKVFATPLIPHIQSRKVDLGIDAPLLLDEFISFLKSLRPDVLHFHCFWPRYIFYLEAAAKLKIKTFITPHLPNFNCFQCNFMQGNQIPCDGVVELKKCSESLINTKTTNRTLQKVIALSSSAIHKLKINVGDGNILSRNLNIVRDVNSFINVLKRINSNVTAVVAISIWYFDVLAKGKYFSESKLKLISTEVSVESRNVAPKNANKALTVAFAGRQSKEKGLHLLLQAIGRIPESKVELYLFGKAMDSEISYMISSLVKKGYKIYQHLETNHEELLNKLSILDVLCLPSVSIEMSPLIIHESLALNIPVIGTNRGGIKELIIDGYNGLLFDYNDSEDLLAKIKLLIGDGVLLKTLKGNCVYKKNANCFLDDYLKLYNKVLSPGE